MHPGDVTVPDPELLGIKPPLATRRTSGGGEGSTRRMAWHPTHAGPAPVAKLTTPEPAGKTEQTDLNIDPAADHDHFSHFESDQPAAEKNDQCRGHPARRGYSRRAVREIAVAPATSGAGNAFSESADH